MRLVSLLCAVIIVAQHLRSIRRERYPRDRRQAQPLSPEQLRDRHDLAPFIAAGTFLLIAAFGS